ncbi:MAG: hypothetical protein E7011_04620 [Alphaproteobacteria bacterium]|nr:hypothetical protein [Alphaproteobacteria bacterium]
MSCEKVSFSIKNTNWCNLKCAHCCECSGPNMAPNIMPLGKVEKYIVEFNAMPCTKSEYMVFTGGETLAPYYHNQTQYIPTCLDIAVHNNMVPVVKTNAMWGNDDKMRQLILGDFAKTAYKHKKLMTIEMSVDEFHNNLNGVANVIRDVSASDYLSPAIRLSMVGLNTPKQMMVFAELLMQLCNRGLLVAETNDNTLLIEVPGKLMFPVFCDTNSKIASAGRAQENNLGVYKLDGRPDDTGHCLMVDNNDMAVLNNVFRSKINGQPLTQVVNNLMQNIR